MSYLKFDLVKDKNAKPYNLPSYSPSLLMCPDCGSLNKISHMENKDKAACGNCNKTLYVKGNVGINHVFSYSVSGIIFFICALSLPLLDFSIGGLTSTNTLLSGVNGLYESNFLWIASIVLFCSVIFPLIHLTLLVVICIATKTGRFNPLLAFSLKFESKLNEWAMMDVYLLAIIVAYIKVADFGSMATEMGLWFFIAALGCRVGALNYFNSKVIWNLFKAPEEPSANSPQKLCLECSYRLPIAEAKCPRCGSRVYLHKVNSINRTWALVITGIILLIPANLLPVMTVVSFGRSDPNTITSGIISLIQSGMLSIAILVFVASFAIPFLKLLSLLWLLLSIKFNKIKYAKQDTALYRSVNALGRWSMLDLFMISILVALVNMGAIANIQANFGETAFATAVVVTMLAAAAFDPRLIWHNKESATHKQ